MEPGGALDSQKPGRAGKLLYPNSLSHHQHHGHSLQYTIITTASLFPSTHLLYRLICIHHFISYLILLSLLSRDILATELPREILSEALTTPPITQDLLLCRILPIGFFCLACCETDSTSWSSEWPICYHSTPRYAHLAPAPAFVLPTSSLLNADICELHLTIRLARTGSRPLL